MVDVHDENENLLFVNPRYAVGGFDSMVKHVVRDENYIKREEQ